MKLLKFKNLYFLSNFQICSKFKFSSHTSIKYPDEIIVETKNFLKGQGDQLTIENHITENIHFFDSEQFTDLVTLFGSKDQGSEDLWDLFSRKIYDYNINFVQARDIFNSLVDSGKQVDEITWKCLRVIYSKNETDSEKNTYNLLI